MTPTLCRCGWHKDRCRCAPIRALVYAEVADHLLDCARAARRRFGEYDELAGIYDDKADYFADLAEGALAQPQRRRLMPIRPENRNRYPRDWRQIVARIRERSGNRCEGSPAYPDCRVANGDPHPVTGAAVVLTVAHLDHTPENCDEENLRHWCQRCHNTYDAPMRRRGVAERAKASRAIAEFAL